MLFRLYVEFNIIEPFLVIKLRFKDDIMDVIEYIKIEFVKQDYVNLTYSKSEKICVLYQTTNFYNSAQLINHLRGSRNDSNFDKPILELFSYDPVWDTKEIHKIKEVLDVCTS